VRVATARFAGQVAEDAVFDVERALLVRQLAMTFSSVLVMGSPPGG